jgi:hypothetical protein
MRKTKARERERERRGSSVIFRAILHNSQSGDHPQEDLANFKLNMKVIKKKTPTFIFLSYLML